MVNNFYQKKWVRAILILLLGFCVLQFFRPRLDNPPVTLDLTASAEIKQILQLDCYDCHSNQTRLAWFDQITPANWLVVSHIKEGRAVLNFSNWDSLTPPQRKGKLFESLYMMEQQTMPLSQYTALHRGAMVTDRQIAVLKDYLTSLSPAPVPDTAKQRAADEQYTKWLQGTTGAGAAVLANNVRSALKEVKPELNGIAFMPDYKNWTAISTSERFDNYTLRVIMGNDIAVRAIKDGQINPWPDGATFAKIAWAQNIDSAGEIHAGEFLQVEFMIKDKAKYASTEGWGFARWVKGLQLAPYGKTAAFTTECTNCHQPMKDNDFVFTMPLNLFGKAPDAGNPSTRLYNEEASVSPASAPGASFNPLQWKVIGSSVNKRDQTMSTLYGNDIAVSAARSGGGSSYPPGSVLSLVTWSQKSDKHYFGANIPLGIRSIEKMEVRSVGSASSGGSGMKNGSGITKGLGTTSVYERFEGAPLKKVDSVDGATDRVRMNFILAQRASVMP